MNLIEPIFVLVERIFNINFPTRKKLELSFIFFFFDSNAMKSRFQCYFHVNLELGEMIFFFFRGKGAGGRKPRKKPLEENVRN